LLDSLRGAVIAFGDNGVSFMAVTKTIVCLANSRKLSGRCVAGREVTPSGPGQWIRPVSARPSEEVSEHERQYANGSDPKVLDIVRVPLLEAKPKTFQSENWLLDPNSYWERVGVLPVPDLENYRQDPDQLWLNGFHTYNGINDRVPEDKADALTESLYLVRLEGMTFNVLAPGAAFGNTRRRVQGSFTHKGVKYALRVTDPSFENEFLKKPDGSYSEGPCFATVSLGERFEGFCYKLVAAVIRITP
jgi:hypothetical protein